MSGYYDLHGGQQISLSTLTADSQLSVIKVKPSLAETALPSLTELFRKLNLSIFESL